MLLWNHHFEKEIKTICRKKGWIYYANDSDCFSSVERDPALGKKRSERTFCRWPSWTCCLALELLPASNLQFYLDWFAEQTAKANQAQSNRGYHTHGGVLPTIDTGTTLISEPCSAFWEAWCPWRTVTMEGTCTRTGSAAATVCSCWPPSAWRSRLANT